MEKFAIIKTGGKQYKVAEKDVLKIEKIPGKAGEAVEFDKILLTVDGENVEIGKPVVAGKKVVGKILEQGRSKKVLVVKYKPKVRYKKRVGHKQMFTRMEIVKI